MSKLWIKIGQQNKKKYLLIIYNKSYKRTFPIYAKTNHQFNVQYQQYYHSKSYKIIKTFDLKKNIYFNGLPNNKILRF